MNKSFAYKKKLFSYFKQIKYIKIKSSFRIKKNISHSFLIFFKNQQNFYFSLVFLNL